MFRVYVLLFLFMKLAIYLLIQSSYAIFFKIKSLNLFFLKK